MEHLVRVYLNHKVFIQVRIFEINPSHGDMCSHPHGTSHVGTNPRVPPIRSFRNLLHGENRGKMTFASLPFYTHDSTVPDSAVPPQHIKVCGHPTPGSVSNPMVHHIDLAMRDMDPRHKYLRCEACSMLVHSLSISCCRRPIAYSLRIGEAAFYPTTAIYPSSQQEWPAMTSLKQRCTRWKHPRQ